MAPPEVTVIASMGTGTISTESMDYKKSASSGMEKYNTDHQAATLTWNALRVVGKDVKGHEIVILDSVSGYVQPKRMLAIMGPSGSGKTTLLDTLAGRAAKNLTATGDILLNGRQSNLSYGLSSYVTQDEVLMGVLTVRETITYAALLRLPASMSRAQKDARVESVIEEMGLTDVAKTEVGNWYLKGISNGQKRRLAIACELVTHPTLIFLDEPTSGLDAAAAFYVMEIVRSLAEHNRTIVTVIHQPSSEVFELFDQLALLSTGQMVYFGSAPDALKAFEAAGMPCPDMRAPTDHFLHVINQDFQATGEGEHLDVAKNRAILVERYNALLLPKVLATVEEHSSTNGPEYKGTVNEANWFYQTWLLTHRNLVNNWRNIGMFWIRLVMYLMLSISVGTVFLRLGHTWLDTFSRTAMMFYLAAFLTFMSISGFPAFVEDMLVFVRERLNGYYQVSSYVIGNSLASVPFIFAIALLNSCVVYWLVGLNDEGDRFPYFFLTLWAALMVVESLMLAIAAIVPHYLMGIAAGAGMLGTFMLVAGFLQPVASIPAPVWRYPMHFIGYHTYAFAGFMHNEFDGTDGWGCPCEIQAGGCAGQNCTTVTGQEVINFFITGRSAELGKWADFGILIAMTVGYRFFFWAMLVLKEKMSS